MITAPRCSHCSADNPLLQCISLMSMKDIYIYICSCSCCQLCRDRVLRPYMSLPPRWMMCQWRLLVNASPRIFADPAMRNYWYKWKPSNCKTRLLWSCLQNYQFNLALKRLHQLGLIADYGGYLTPKTAIYLWISIWNCKDKVNSKLFDGYVALSMPMYMYDVQPM